MVEIQVHNIFSYYKNKCFRKLSETPIKEQLKSFKNMKIVLLDFCGAISKHKKMFIELDIRIFIIESDDDILSILEYNYDVILVMAYEEQIVNIDHPHFLISLIRNKIISSKYVKNEL